MEGKRVSVSASYWADGEPAYYRVKIEGGPAFEVLCERFDALCASAKAAAIAEWKRDE